MNNENKESNVSFERQLSDKHSINKIYWNRLSYYLISFYSGVSSITELAVSYYFKDHLAIGPSVVSKLTTAIILPWSFKPLLGLITDCIPIYGYKRKYYIILSGIISCLCWFFMSTSPNLHFTVFYLVIINIFAAFSSVLGEAVVVDLAKNTSENDESDEKNKNAKDFVSLFMIFKYLGMLFASFMKGQLVESIGLKSIFIIGSILPCLVILAGVVLLDTNINAKENNHDEENLITKREEDINTPSINDLYNFIIQRRIFVPLVFILIFMSTPSYNDPFFYFLTNELKFTPKSLGQISFWSMVGVLIGVYIYKQYFKNVEFKNVLVVCTLLLFMFTFFAYILVLRVNIKYGINDFIIVLFSNSVMTMLGEIMCLPLLSLACVLCPKNMEGTVFSVFTSAINLGGAVSSILGSYLTSYLGITSNDFTNLHILIMVTNISSLLPLVLIVIVNQKYFLH